MIGIAALRHRVTLCRQNDVATVAGDLMLAREGVLARWAQVIESSSSTFSGHGANMADNRSARTHQITMRYEPDLNVSVMAWLYEVRVKSSARWFKILRVKQTEIKGTQYFTFDCRIHERGDDLAKPTGSGPAVGLPDGFQL